MCVFPFYSYFLKLFSVVLLFCCSAAPLFCCPAVPLSVVLLFYIIMYDCILPFIPISFLLFCSFLYIAFFCLLFLGPVIPGSVFHDLYSRICIPWPVFRSCYFHKCNVILAIITVWRQTTWKQVYYSLTVIADSAVIL